MMDQPSERRVKKILVAVHCEGRQVWALLEAVKVGRHYQIEDDRVRQAMIQDVRQGDNQKRVSWG